MPQMAARRLCREARFDLGSKMSFSTKTLYVCSRSRASGLWFVEAHRGDGVEYVGAVEAHAMTWLLHGSA
jgi:hypothetical protein